MAEQGQNLSAHFTQKGSTNHLVPATSVTRLGDFLHFGQLLKAFGNN